MDENKTFIIAERDGFSQKIGLLVSMLENARHYLKQASRNLSVEQLDAKPGGAVNSIGQLLAHLCAAEVFFQAMTFHDRRFNDQEAEEWGEAFAFGKTPKATKRTIHDYIYDLDSIRAKTLTLMAKRDDSWLEQAMTFFGQPANINYYWFHYLQDEVRHTGQISLIRKHLLPNPEPDFNPYRIDAD